MECALILLSQDMVGGEGGGEERGHNGFLCGKVTAALE